MITRMILFFVFALAAFGQTQASRFIPLKGTTAPATCTVGELFYDTDAPAGSNLYACTATNTWTLQAGGSGATYPTDLLCKLTVSTATATFASGASGTNPCNFQTGSFTAAATLAISGSPPVGTYWWETDGANIYVKLPGADSGLTASGVTKVASVSGFTAGRVPIGKTSYTSGANWDSTVEDNRPHFSLSLNPVAGALMSSSDSGANRTLNVDGNLLYATAACRSTTGNDTYTCTTTPTTLAYSRGRCYVLDADTANTGTATLQVDGAGSAQSILRYNGDALQDGDIVANKPVTVCHDGTQFIIQGGGGGGSGDMVLASAQTSTAKKTFNPTGTSAGLAVQCTTLPSSPANGDFACDSADSNRVKVYSAGTWVTAGGPACNVPYDVTTLGFTYGHSTSALISATANTPHVRPWANECWRTIKRVSINIAAAGTASESTQLGIYSPDCQTQLATTGIFSSTSTGVVGLVFGTAVALAPGSYCVMLGSNSGTLTASHNTAGGVSAYFSFANTTTVKYGKCTNAMTGSGASAVLPTSCGTINSNFTDWRPFNLAAIPD